MHPNLCALTNPRKHPCRKGQAHDRRDDLHRPCRVPGVPDRGAVVVTWQETPTTADAARRPTPLADLARLPGCQTGAASGPASRPIASQQPALGITERITSRSQKLRLANDVQRQRYLRLHQILGRGI